jgi:hypothetical protein
MSDPAMIPLGYMLKSVMSPAPEWMGAPKVEAVHSVSGCVSSDFGDYIPLWRHNGWWMFDTSEAAQNAAEGLGVEVGPLKAFFYEAFHYQYDGQSRTWAHFAPDDFPTNVVPPSASTLNGFDVVTFFAGTSPECSPLSCNGLASSLDVNSRCLFDTLGEARIAIESGAFANAEPGPYRIIAVRSVET